MKHRARCGVMALMTYLVTSLAMAQAPDDPTGRKPIPFKHDPVSIEEHGWQVSAILLVLLGGAAAVLYGIRRKVPGAIQRPAPEARVTIIDRLRIDQRTQVYVLQFRGRQYLLAQSGDRLLQLRETGDTVDGVPGASEASHA